MEETNQPIEPTPSTESVPPTLTQPAEPQLPQASTGAMIGMVFSDPFLLGKHVTARPTWWIPFVIVAIFSMAFTIIGSKQLVAMTGRKVEQQLSKSSAQIPADKQKEVVEMATKWTKISAPIFGAVGSLFMALIGALVVLFICNLLMGGTAKFKTVFAGLMWVQLISAAGVLVKLPMVLIRDTFEVPIGPAVLMPEGSEGFVYTLLAGLDFFTIWLVIAGGMSIAGIYNWGKGKGITVAVVIYAIVLLASAGLASMGGAVNVQAH
jgi:hypothetical protein